MRETRHVRYGEAHERVKASGCVIKIWEALHIKRAVSLRSKSYTVISLKRKVSNLEIPLHIAPVLAA